MRLIVFLFALVLLAMFISSQVARAEDANQPKGITWSPPMPESNNIDTAALEALYAGITEDEHHDLKGIVILRDGRLVSERYFNDDSAATLHDIRSATKSITALLMGIAIQHGLIHSVNDSIARYLPGLPADGKEKIAIKDLLNMRSGLDADDDNPTTPGNEDNLDRSSDWMQTVYSVPTKEPPGRTYNYASINAFPTGAIIENASHMPLDQFAADTLFRPLGIDKFTWRHVPINRVTGQGNLSITTRDLAAIGELVLNKGRVAGTQIVPENGSPTARQSRLSARPTIPTPTSAATSGTRRLRPSETARSKSILRVVTAATKPTSSRRFTWLSRSHPAPTIPTTVSDAPKAFSSKSFQRHMPTDQRRRFANKPRYTITMSIQEIEAAVQQLPSQELSQFAAWFAQFHADAWDAQIERDAVAGKLDALAAEAMAEYHSGRTTEI